MSFSLKRSALKALWYSFIGVVVLNIGYQLVLSWHQLDSLRTALPFLVGLAVANQLLAYMVLVPAMRRFYDAAGLRLSVGRAFALMSTGIAVSRILPAGEYIVWRLGLRRRRGSAGVTTQWYILYLSGVLIALVALFLVLELLVLVVYPNGSAGTVVSNLQYVPLILGLVLVGGVLALRIPGVRHAVVNAALDQVSSRAISPQGIIRERRLGLRDIWLLGVGSFGTWIFEGITLGLCFMAMGLEIPWLLVLCGFAFARLVANLPIIPGGIGAMEAGTAVFFAAYGYPAAQVVTATLVYRLITAWLPLAIGLGAYGLASRRLDEDGALDLAYRPFADDLHSRVQTKH